MNLDYLVIYSTLISFKVRCYIFTTILVHFLCSFVPRLNISDDLTFIIKIHIIHKVVVSLSNRIKLLYHTSFRFIKINS